jgi:hypothetical protein
MHARPLCAAAVLATALVSGTASAQVSKDVNVVNTPTVNVSASQNRVTVGNTADNPVPVVDARAARVPVQVPTGCFVDNSICTGFPYIVPDGKRLVIEQIALATTGPVTEGGSIGVTLFAKHGTDAVGFPIALTPVPHTDSSGTGYVHFVATHPVTIFAGPLEHVYMQAKGTRLFEGFTGALSGYLEDLP